MDDKKFDLDEILGESSSVKKNSDYADLDDLDISFKKRGTEQKKDYSAQDIDELLSFSSSSSNKKTVLSEKVSDSDTNKSQEGASVIIDEPKSSDEAPKQEKSDFQTSTLDDLKKHFSGTGSFDANKTEAVNDKKRPAVHTVKEAKKTDHKSSKKKKKKKSRFNGSILGGIIIITIILTVSLVLAVGGISVGMEYYGIGKSDNEISFTIPEGSSNEKIAQILEEKGVIDNHKLFVLAIRLQKPATIYPGDITLKPSMGYSTMIEELAKMRESYESVTITFTEGETLLDVAKKLEENGVCEASDFLFEFNKNQNYSFESRIKENENAFYAREGYFFPDTYDFYVGDTASNITRIVREHFESKLTDKMYTRMDKLGLDLNEVMTLASLVQLEANSKEEMPLVASVFLNRLEDDDTFPMLQSDTTSNYIKNVISSQTSNETAIDHYTDYYDTYQCKGLPASPICNPGLDAINAVLYPEDTKYYYFCNNLETGESFFAETLEEHEENLIKAGLATEKKED